ncbi:MAG: DUF4249 domain-containing protein [Bacteroidota bacterium]
MKRYKILFFIPITALTLFTACQKVVDINLNASDPRLIIEANLSDQPKSCIVTLSQSVNYNESNTFPTVSGAIVTISDNVGNSTTLSEIRPGYYTDSLFAGVPGRTYTLSVTAAGKTYEAVSAMPQPVDIDTLVQDSIPGGSFGFGSFTTRIFVSVLYHDPAGIVNFYRFVEIVNHKPANSILVSDDELRDGSLLLRRIVRFDTTLVKGDSVTLELRSIDKPVFNYLDQLNEDIGGNFGNASATPANPISNLSNGALGFFSAYAVKAKSLVVQ